MSEVNVFTVPGRYLVTDKKNPGAQDVVLLSDYAELEAEISVLRERQQQVVMPERIARPATRTEEAFGYRNGWNDCIDEFKRLNGGNDDE